ncbi:hypothetical protein, partial [Mesomycoplasma ovipneumoniae]|uniref:hypothetical protein n=1 Tax=Mesomycoplasma ovipneumoniae TaxID=29562 RepID=UPI002964D297
LKPQVAEYFRKNPSQSLAKLISDYQAKSSAADSKVAEVFDAYHKDNNKIKQALMPESTTASQSESSESEFDKKLKELASAGEKNSQDAVKKYLKDEYNIDVPDSTTSGSTGTTQSQPVAVQASVAALGSTSQPQAQQEQQQESQVPEVHVEQQQQESQVQEQQAQQETQTQQQQPQTETPEEIAKKDKAFYAPYFEIYNYQLPTMQSGGQSVLVTPDQIDFWFETNSNLKVGDYNFDFSLDKNQDESSSAKTLKLNVNFEADSNFKLEVSPENVPYLEIYEGIEKPKPQTTESQTVNVAVATTTAP